MTILELILLPHYIIKLGLKKLPLKIVFTLLNQYVI